MMQDLLSLDKEGKPTFDAVKKYLQQKYPESDAASLQKAAENLTSVFALVDGIEKDDAAKLIAERYADSWRNNAIQGLPKGWKPTGAALGVQFLAGFWPVGTLSVKLSKYHNEGYEDTKNSLKNLRQRAEYGIGNETLPGVED